MFQWLKKLFRSIENPSHPLIPEDWTGNNDHLTQSKALTYSAVWRAISVISNDVARLPLLVYRRVGEGKDRATDHPAYPLLKAKPNPYLTSFTFKQTVQSHALRWGNGYAAINRLTDGSPVEMVILDPRNTFPLIQSGKLAYQTKDGEEDILLAPEDVLHIRGLGEMGLQGYPLIEECAAKSLQLGLSMRDYGKRFFDNNARPNLAIKHPGVLTEQAQGNLIRSWERAYKGADNAHKVSVLAEGMDIREFGINARDAQLVEARAFEIREVANFFGIGAWLLGDPSRTSYASLEIEKLAYLDQLEPWLIVWEQECWDKLLTEQEKEEDSVVIEFMRQAMLKPDTKARYEVYAIALDKGILTVNEVRAMENLDPLPEPEPEPVAIDNSNEGNTLPDEGDTSGSQPNNGDSGSIPQS